MSNLPGHGQSASGTNNLVDHGRRILPSSKIYYIWWGSQSEWPADARLGLTTFAQDLNSSSFLEDIFPQYMRAPAPRRRRSLTVLPSPEIMIDRKVSPAT